MFDNGINPKDCEPDEVAHSDGSVRNELGVVMYAPNVLGSRGPRKMQVALPGLDADGNIIQFKDASGGHGHANTAGDDMMTKMKERNFRDMQYLINKPPRWNEQVKVVVYGLNCIDK